MARAKGKKATAAKPGAKKAKPAKTKAKKREPVKTVAKASTKGVLKEKPAAKVVAKTSKATAETAANSGGDLPFAAELWETAERLRGSIDSSEYKHLVLGLIFLKYISDSFERQRAKLEEATHDKKSDLFTEDDKQREEILEDRDEYRQENVFWVPEEARFEPLLTAANQPDLGQQIDKALEAIERDNPDQLRGVLPKVYGRTELEPQKLGELLNVIARVGFGEDEDKARDLLGRTYEYFIKMFAKQEGHRGGEFYTPATVVRLLVEMLEPLEGRVLDPACGSCGMFIQSARFVEAHGGRAQRLPIYGQELNHTTGRIGRMNLAIHGLSGNIKIGQSSLTADQHPGLKADFVLANPMFNQEFWGAEQVADDPGWKYGLPPDRNANFAWIQHFISHLTPNGRAGFVMANGSLTVATGGEGDIREGIVRDDLVDCIIALPKQLFFTTGIPVCLWFIDRAKADRNEGVRAGQSLFIDARRLGQRLSSTQIEFSEQEIDRIASTYHAWRGEDGVGEYEDVPGFCASAGLEQIERHAFAIAPGRYISVPESEDDGTSHEERMTELVAELANQIRRSEQVTAELKQGLGELGHEL